MRIPKPGLRRLRTPTLIIAVLGFGVAIAPNTSALSAVRYVVLGGANSTTAATTITNTGGTPLSLKAKSGTPPLAVNTTKVVPRLNADYVDGYHASSFAKVAAKTGIVPALDAPVTCPKGTTLTGGGGLAETSLGYSGPGLDTATSTFIPNSWEALDAAGGSAYSLAVCYNPTGGSIPGAISRSGLAKMTSSLRAKAASAPTASDAPPTPSPTSLRTPY